MARIIEAWAAVKCTSEKLERFNQAGTVMAPVDDKDKEAEVKWDVDGAVETVKLTDITVLS